MKKFGITLLIIIIIFLVIIGIFWDRFSGAYQIYCLTGQLHQAMLEGCGKLNVDIKATWGDDQKAHRVLSQINYQKDGDFAFNLDWDGNRYQITSDDRRTEVHAFKQGLSVTGTGTERIDFDPFKILGEIYANHHDLNQLIEFTSGKRLLISAVSLVKCDFIDTVYQEIPCEIIAMNEPISGTKIQLWWNFGKTYIYRLLASKAGSLSEVIIRSDVAFSDMSESLPTPESALAVNRQELNTSIYRGAIRAAGISIENMLEPGVDETEKSWGKSRLIFKDGNRILIGRGSHRELGQAHGTLLAREARNLVDATLYAVGWYYTLERKRWLLDEMRSAYRRLEPFIPRKYQDEMEGLAETSGISLEEVRLANVFPALFHCSGFGIFNTATKDSVLYHGRVLDYMVDAGLQFSAVVYAYQPDNSAAFANIGYAGFIGSISGMNEHQVAFGEMGGRGEGDWDGMPMPFLMREGLERAKTLEEALAIFRDTPRTCQYFYVISDGKLPDARGLATTPKQFELIEPNQFHELLPHPMPDVVLMSAGKRYEKLAERVKDNFGKIDCDMAIHLMDRPVAMKSNLHDVLFVPQKLEFWVANAGAGTPACNEPYTQYSLKELLGKIDTTGGN
ncbi:hypothetical protein JXJ21_26825 [candidate division KSB1 bacterium]|nr:hypothetical protein [candidate division KSB1 bacterium]